MDEEEEVKSRLRQTTTNAIHTLHITLYTTYENWKSRAQNQLTNNKFLIQINISFVTCIFRVAPTKFSFIWHMQQTNEMHCKNPTDYVSVSASVCCLSIDCGGKFICKIDQFLIQSTIIR